MKTNKAVKIASVVGLVGVLLVGASAVSFAEGEGGGLKLDLSFAQMKELIGLVMPVAEPAPVFGAGSSLATDSFVEFGGVTHEYRSQVWNTATNTPCIFSSPAASSTLIHLSAVSNTVTSTGTFEVYAADTQATGTNSTLITQLAATEGLNIEIVATSTETVNGNAAFLISPSSVISFDYSGATTSLSTDTAGTCKAEFIVL